MCLHFVSPARFPVKAGDQTVSSVCLVFSIILVVRRAGAWEMAYNICSLGKKERQSQNVGLLCLPIPSSVCDKASFNSWVKKDSQDEFGLKTAISCAKGTKICGINVLFGPRKSQTLEPPLHSTLLSCEQVIFLSWVAQDDLDLLLFLPFPPKWRNHRCAPPCPFPVVLGSNPGFPMW